MQNPLLAVAASALEDHERVTELGLSGYYESSEQ